MKKAIVGFWCAVTLTVCPLSRGAINEPRVGDSPPASGVEIPIFSFGTGKSSPLRVGDTPPPLELKKLLQAPADARPNWEGLKGKVVVLEFWATWCGPCIAAIPHLNELADRFKDKPVQFIAITAEDEQVVGPFLKKKPIHAWVGLDTDKLMSKAYGIEAIPHTVVVDREGKIAAVTHPTMLTEQHLEDVLAGKKLALPQPERGSQAGFRPGELPGGAQQGSEALFQVLVKPSETDQRGFASGNGSRSIVGSDVMGILSLCYDMNRIRIVTNCVLPDGRFDVAVKTPAKENDGVNSWLRLAVETTFGLAARKEVREMDVYVLTAKNPNAENLAPTVSTGGSSSSYGPGHIQAINGSMGSLARGLETLLKRPVLDETGLTNRYDFELKWEVKEPEPPDPEPLITALRQQLGLELTPAKRTVEVLVVDSTKKERE